MKYSNYQLQTYKLNQIKQQLSLLKIKVAYNNIPLHTIKLISSEFSEIKQQYNRMFI